MLRIARQKRVSEPPLPDHLKAKGKDAAYWREYNARPHRKAYLLAKAKRYYRVGTTKGQHNTRPKFLKANARRAVLCRHGWPAITAKMAKYKPRKAV